MKLLTRIMVLPLVMSLYLVFHMINYFKAMWLFINNGGIFTINSEEEI